MIKTTLCYIEQDGKYLMLHRNKKKQDPNEGKWIGVGGKLEKGESPEECLVREVQEETGLELEEYTFRGEIFFSAQGWEEEIMYLYTATKFHGEITDDCAEGELKWISFQEIPKLSLWEGDRVFLADLLAGKKEINLALYYEGDRLVRVERRNSKVSVDGKSPFAV